MTKKAEKYDGSTPLQSVMQESAITNILSGMGEGLAYKSAGYKAKNPAAGMHQLRRNTKFAARLAFRRAELQRDLDITPEKNLRAIANSAYVDVADFYNADGSMKNIHDIPKAARMAIAGIDVEELYEGRGENRRRVGTMKRVRCWDANRAREMIAKIFGQFERDNSQKRSLTLVEILAIVNGSRDTGPS